MESKAVTFVKQYVEAWDLGMAGDSSMLHDAQAIISSLPAEAQQSDEHGEYKNLPVGQRVHVHTGEEGVIVGINANKAKRYHVLISPGFGGHYGSWEVTPSPVVSIPDSLLVELFYAAQGDITQFRIKAQSILNPGV